MLLEHLIYSTAIAIIIGAFHQKYFGKDYSWIIILSAYSPDFDILPKYFGYNLTFNGIPLFHASLHNLVGQVLYALLLALLLRLFSLDFRHSFVFAGIGFGAHLFEDALVFNPAYPFLWPIYDQDLGLGILRESWSFYGIADRETLAIGLFSVLLACVVRLILLPRDRPEDIKSGT